MSFAIGLLGKCGDEFTIPKVIVPELEPRGEIFYITLSLGLCLHKPFATIQNLLADAVNS